MTRLGFRATCHGGPVTGRRETATRTPVFETIAAAALRLGVDARALRRRCNRHGQRVGDYVVVHLDGGLVAFKFGPRWRLRFKRA
jgi:hypothetical protein